MLLTGVCVGARERTRRPHPVALGSGFKGLGYGVKGQGKEGGREAARVGG